jgi:hypothetical protein
VVNALYSQDGKKDPKAYISAYFYLSPQFRVIQSIIVEELPASIATVERHWTIWKSRGYHYSGGLNQEELWHDESPEVYGQLVSCPFYLVYL